MEYRRVLPKINGRTLLFFKLFLKSFEGGFIMLVISVRNFSKQKIEKINEQGYEYIFVDNSGLDPHNVHTSDYFNRNIYDLCDDIKKKATILIMDSFHVTSKLLDECPNVKWIQHPGAGVNAGQFWTDWELIDKKGVIVTTAKIHAVPISEMIITFMLDLLKHMPRFYERKKNKVYGDKANVLPMLLDKKKVLIIGTGHIGCELAKKLKLAFDTYIAGINSDRRKLDYFDEIYTQDSLLDIVGEFDFVVITCPLTEKTKHLIDSRVFERMKRTAYVINPSRGSIINENDLIHALETNQIAGAALDTFEEEPLPKDSKLWELDNVIITPHLSGFRPDYDDAVFEIFYKNLIHFKNGEFDKMEGVANKKGY